MPTILACYDGSPDSAASLAAVSGLMARPGRVVVLTVWEPLEVRLANTGAFSSAFATDLGSIDTEEAQSARQYAEDGARQAREHGWEAEALVRETRDGGVMRTIVEVADEIGADLIICGRHGRSRVAETLLGSVSHGLLLHAGRPVLVSPRPH